MNAPLLINDDPSSVIPLAKGSHVCWVVGRDDAYVDHALALLEDGATYGEKRVVFGPDGGHSLTSLAPFADAAADPRVAFLDGGPLDPERMFAMFEEQMELAHEERFSGLRLVADMDWLLDAQPSTSEILAFELQLDRAVAELGATVICAYRQGTFDGEAVDGNLCIHPVRLGGLEPPFRLVARRDRTWELSGEVDLMVGNAFAEAFKVAARDAVCIVDASGLSFIDVGGVRAIAQASRPDGLIVIRGAPPTLRRCWELGGFAEIAPNVDFDVA